MGQSVVHCNSEMLGKRTKKQTQQTEKNGQEIKATLKCYKVALIKSKGWKLASNVVYVCHLFLDSPNIKVYPSSFTFLKKDKES